MHWLTGVIVFAAGCAVTMVLRQAVLASGPAGRAGASSPWRRGRRSNRPLWWYD